MGMLAREPSAVKLLTQYFQNDAPTYGFNLTAAQLALQTQMVAYWGNFVWQMVCLPVACGSAN
jgi:hypothetical protein